MTTNYVNFLLLYSIAAKDIKHMSFVDTDQLLDQVESILLQRNRTADDDQIFKVAYKMTGGQVFGGTQDTMNTTCVKVSIRKTLANQIVRPIWEGNLIPISHANYDTLPIFARHALPNNSASNQYENASSLAFSIILGDTITKLQRDITALRQENDQLRINADRWKGTAQKLNNQWQSEKSELTERFLTLFNQHKGRHVELKKELDELKGNQRYERGESYLKPPPHSDHKERPEMRPDDEDEHDYVLYDDDYVNRMAAGGAVQQKRRRKNSTTEKTEVENVKALFSSDEEDNDMGV
jgi:gas vesicle protein